MKARTQSNPSAAPTGPHSGTVEIDIDPPAASSTKSTLQRMSGSGTIQSGQPAPLTMPFAPGDVIGGKYQIIGLIGAGGVAFVVAALHLELGEMVALKFLRPEALAHEEMVERFASEARAAAKIKSEYVCRVYDVGTLPDGVPFIVMEYLEGKDLSDIVREKGKLSISMAVEYVLQACEALACSHAAGIVHRDIKPENLFVTRQAANVDVVKVLDFGISKTALKAATGGKRRFAKTMMPMGTPAYMSPEQIRACGTVDARADIWAIGCVLFELLTGACAFDAPTLMQLGAAILERDAIPLRTVRSDAPAELEAVILKCLEKDPNKRFQNVAQLATALYPFGPRRARLCAERCNQILQSASDGPVLELASVSPPPLRVVESRSPTAAPAPETKPSAVEQYPEKRRSRLAPVFAVLVLAAGAAAYGLHTVSKSGSEAAVSTAANVAAPAAVSPAAAPANTTAPAPGVQAAPPTSATAAAAAADEAQSEAEDSEKPRARRPRSTPTPSQKVRRDIPAPTKVKPVTAVRQPVLNDEEPDVGF